MRAKQHRSDYSNFNLIQPFVNFITVPEGKMRKLLMITCLSIALLILMEVKQLQYALDAAQPN